MGDEYTLDPRTTTQTAKKKKKGCEHGNEVTRINTYVFPDGFRVGNTIAREAIVYKRNIPYITFLAMTYYIINYIFITYMYAYCMPHNKYKIVQGLKKLNKI